MRRITITYEIVTEESAEQGDVEERGWIDEEGIEIKPDQYDLDGYDDDMLSAIVHLACEVIEQRGPVEVSSSRFGPGIWYTQLDPTQDRAYFEEGRSETWSFHLEGFTETEECAIYNAIGNCNSRCYRAAMMTVNSVLRDCPYGCMPVVGANATIGDTLYRIERGAGDHLIAQPLQYVDGAYTESTTQSRFQFADDRHCVPIGFERIVSVC